MNLARLLWFGRAGRPQGVGAVDSGRSSSPYVPARMPHRLLIRKAEQLGLFAPRPPSTREAVKDVKHVFPGAKEVAPQKPILPRPGPLKPQKLTPGVLRSSAPGVRYHAVIRRGRTVIWKSPRNDYTREEAYDVAEARYAPREQEVKRPGSRGGIGYFDAHGVWRYGDRPGTVPPVEPPSPV